MPSELYLVRPIHGLTGRPCPGERLWSAGLLTRGPAVGFLRARNREGFDIFDVDQEAHAALPDDMQVRLYYTPKSRLLLSIEPKFGSDAGDKASRAASQP